MMMTITVLVFCVVLEFLSLPVTALAVVYSSYDDSSFTVWFGVWWAAKSVQNPKAQQWCSGDLFRRPAASHYVEPNCICTSHGPCDFEQKPGITGLSSIEAGRFAPTVLQNCPCFCLTPQTCSPQRCGTDYGDC